MHYRSGAVSLLGSREEQQDSFFCRAGKDAAFAVVCDGMGGSRGGGLASQRAVGRLLELYQKRTGEEPVPDFLLHAMDVVDESVVALQRETDGCRGAGTTLVAAVLDGSRLFWLSVGDSRLYILRKNEIVRVTRDHNLALRLAQMPESRRMAEREAFASYRQDALVSFVGMGGIELYDLNETAFRVEAGDRILLTTDGLTKLLTDREIGEIARQGEPEAALQRLTAAATEKAAGVQDNTTCILIQAEDEGGMADVE